jgi:hypothetical protein
MRFVSARPLWIRRFLSLAVLTGLAVPAVPALSGTAGAATTTSYFLQTTAVAVGSTGYKMTMSVSGSFLTISLSRTAATGKHPTQTHSYSFFSSGGPFLSCNGTTIACTLDTGTSMVNPAPGGRDYGGITQNFKPTSKTTVTNRCPKPHQGTITGSTTRAPGNLTGPWTLNTYNSFFGALNGRLTNVGAGKIPDKIPATVTKFVSNGKTCPLPPPPPPGPCTQSLSLFANNNDFSNGEILSFSAFRLLPTGTTSEFFSWHEPTAPSAPASITHQVSAFGGPGSALTANGTLTSGHASGAWAGPFLSGATTFTKTRATTSTSRACVNHHHVVTKTSPGKVAGTLAAHFDGIAAKPLGTIPDSPGTGKYTNLQRALKV